MFQAKAKDSKKKNLRPKTEFSKTAFKAKDMNGRGQESRTQYFFLIMIENFSIIERLSA